MENLDFDKIINDLESRMKRSATVKPMEDSSIKFKLINLDKRYKVLIFVLLLVLIGLIYTKPNYICTMEGIGRPKKIITQKLVAGWLFLSGLIYGIIWYYNFRNI